MLDFDGPVAVLGNVADIRDAWISRGGLPVEETATSGTKSMLRRWAPRRLAWPDRAWWKDCLSPRTLRFWALFVLLAWTLAGFFLAPWLVERALVGGIAERLERKARLAEVAVNPFVLSLRLGGFELEDEDGGELLGFDELYINFQASSLVRRAWTFREIRLGGPRLSLVRHPDGSTNLGRLLPLPGPDEEAAHAEDARLPRLVIGHLRLDAGTAKVVDRVPATHFETRLGPVSLELSNLSTLPEDSGSKEVLIIAEQGASLGWSGQLQLQPLLAEGHFQVRGPLLGLVHRYFRDRLDFELQGGDTRIDFAYRVEAGPDGPIGLRIDELVLELDSVGLLDSQDAGELLGWTLLRAEGGMLSWPEREAGLEALELRAPRLHGWRDAEGFNLARLAVPVQGPAAQASEDPEPHLADAAVSSPEADRTDVEQASPWSVRLGELRLTDLGAQLEDRSLEVPASVAVDGLTLRVRDLSNEPGASFPIEAALQIAGGTARLEGELRVLPSVGFDLAFSAEELQLATLDPYVQEYTLLHLPTGALEAQGRAVFDQDGSLGFTGGLAVNGLAVIDRLIDEPLASWGRLEAIGLDYTAKPGRLEIDEIIVDEAYGRIVISAEGDTNLQGLVREREESPRDDGGTGRDADELDEGFELEIGRVELRNGSADFTDLSLPLPFAAHIDALGGTIAPISTISHEPAVIDLEGRIDRYGLAQVQGTVELGAPKQHSALMVLFRNVEMPTLTPYSVAFAGRRIDDGRLDLNLRYDISDSQLEANNHMVMSDLRLGERVPTPGALNLPLGLAVALLTDTNGRIDLEIPVRGNVDDPQFRYGHLVWQALGNVIGRMVTSPFRLLARLVGAESDELGELAFAPGRVDLTPPEQEKVAKLAVALEQRPQLQLVLRGVFDPQADGHALRVAAVDARIEEYLARAEAAGASRAERRLAALEALTLEADPAAAIEEIRGRHFGSPKENDEPAEPVLDQTAYAGELRRMLIELEAVDPGDLTRLADERADSVLEQLRAGSTLDGERIQLRAPGESSAEGGRIAMALELDAGQHALQD